MYPHRIRLRGPWECQPLERRPASEPLPTPLRMTLPCRWADGGLPGFAGWVRFRRRFGYPGQIDSHERVWLTFDALAGPIAIVLNDTPLGQHQEPAQRLELDVTALLRPRNELVVDVEGDAHTGGLTGEVALEIRCLAFLRDVQAHPNRGEIEVTGMVVGWSERPLELYVVCDRRTVAYTRVTPAPAGQPFQVRTEGVAPSAATPPVQVDLINGATVWYSVQVAPS
jgi:hypothetical protein